MDWIVALCWVPFSFLLHNVVHEGAHAVVAKAAGSTVTRFWPFPGWRAGYFTWAHVLYQPEVRGSAYVWMQVAPVIAEFVWMSDAFSAFLLTSGWLQLVLLVEVVSANVDIVNWWLKGFWFRDANPAYDSSKFLKTGVFSKRTCQAMSMGHVMMMSALTAAIVATLLVRP
jgi:hypothetical protein